jgi:N12 class adenine-specific DNA methylase
MGIETLISLLAGTITAVLGGLIPLIEKLYGEKAQEYYNKYPDSFRSKLLTHLFRLDKDGGLSFQQKISKSLDSLKSATSDIDRIIENISKISKEKEESISKLEKQVENLSLRENELKTKIETMEKVPIESIKYFEDILYKTSKRDRKRDYILFTLGVIITTIVAIVLNAL